MRLGLRSVLFVLVILSCFEGKLLSQSLKDLDQEKLEAFIKLNEEIYTDEFMLLLGEERLIHWKGDKCDSVYFGTASMIKSWTGLVVGTLIDKGYISSENELVCDYIPEWTSGCEEQVTIKNLLTMTAGLNKRSGIQGVLAAKDMNQYVIDIELDTTPNARWSYSNESVQLLGVLIENVTGMRASEYFNQSLFEPLGMDSTSLYLDEAGNDIVYGGGRTTVQDASLVALLMRNKGMHNSRQVVSSSWIERSLNESNLNNYYGYLWWIDNESAERNFLAMGDFGQLTIVFPELDLIYIRKQNCNHNLSGNMKFMGFKFVEGIADLIKKD